MLPPPLPSLMLLLPSRMLLLLLPPRGTVEYDCNIIGYGCCW
jgi:hypothetical protein